MKLPVMLSNRTIFNTLYQVEGAEQGEYHFIISSKGNEPYAKAYSHLTGKDVIAQTYLNFFWVKPYKEDG